MIFAENRRHPESREPQQLRVRASVLAAIRDTIGAQPPEHSGILGVDAETGVVTTYVYDDSCVRTSVSNTPDVNRMNRIIKDEWAPAGVMYAGGVHSHPHGCRHPSSGDREYGLRILQAKRSLSALFTWIVLPGVDGHTYELLAYSLDRRGNFTLAEIVVDSKVIANVVPHQTGATSLDEIELAPQYTAVVPTQAAETPHTIPVADVVDFEDASAIRNRFRRRPLVDVSAQFMRVTAAYDLTRTAATRLLCIGTGGIRDTILCAARAGIEEFVLIDPDTIAPSNIATQAVYRNEIGIAKVEAVRNALYLINPNVRVVAIKATIDAINDERLERLIHEPMLSLRAPDRGVEAWRDVPPALTICVAGTDCFYAQARSNRIGLQWGIPTLASQVYAQGLAAEVTFTHPDVTPACQRCILCTRYRAYLDEGFTNTVGSSGAPICATQRLAALEGQILMALIHHGTDHPRFGGVLASIGNRNLIQIRLSEDVASSLGLRVFDRVFAGADRDRVLFDDVVWLPQDPEDGQRGRPVCPECGGTGNLRRAMSSFTDTRVMPLR